jgi:uncharacterized protein YndB with AHSA1/START domain
MSEKASFKVDREKLEVTVTRIFDSPRDRVWKAYTDPKLIQLWWGPRFLKTTVDKMEFRTGGTWRFVHEDPEKKIYGFHGEYREIIEGKLIVSTFIFEPVPDSIVVDTTTFEELSGGRTKVTQVSRFPSKEALDGMVSAGMEKGSTEAGERLKELLERQRKKETVTA